MIGIDFVAFLILLIISVIVSLILHFVLKTQVRAGFESFVGKVIWGWIGAWLGSPVFGYWFTGWNYHGVYIIPAILGSFALPVLMIDLVKTFKATNA
jgi:uncharacterized membrane protein YeaQ/YmgE (transglycosylase-associated protein family)